MDNTQLQKALESKNVEQVKAALNGILGQELTDDERSEVFTALASAQIDVKNELLEEETKILDGFSKAMDGVLDEEKKHGEKSALEDVKKQIENS